MDLYYLNPESLFSGFFQVVLHYFVMNLINFLTFFGVFLGCASQLPLCYFILLDRTARTHVL